MSCTCDIPFDDCPHAMIYPHADKWYCTKIVLSKKEKPTVTEIKARLIAIIDNHKSNPILMMLAIEELINEL